MSEMLDKNTEELSNENKTQEESVTTLQLETDENTGEYIVEGSQNELDAALKQIIKDKEEEIKKEYGEDALSENIEPEKPIDWEKIQLDDNGIPVLTDIDIKSLIAFNFLGLGAEDIISQIKMVRFVIEQILESQNEKDEEGNPKKISDEDAKTLQDGKEYLARLQYEARDKETIIKNSRKHDAAEQGIMLIRFFTIIYKHIILKNKSDLFFNTELNLEENLKEYNYATLINKMLDNYINDLLEKLKINSFINDIDLFKKLLIKNEQNFTLLFRYISSVFRQNCCVRTSRTLDNLISKQINDLYDMMTVGIVNSKDVKEKFLECAFENKTEATDEEKEKRIENINKGLEYNKFYQEFLRYDNNTDLINISINISKKIYKLVDKLSEIDKNNILIEKLAKLCIDARKEKDLIINKYVTEQELSDSERFNKFIEIINEQIKKVDEEGLKEKQEKDNNPESQDADKQEFDDTQNEIQEEFFGITQSTYDKISLKLYPDLEAVKVYKALEESISYFLSNPNNKYRAYNLLVTLMNFYLTDIIYNFYYNILIKDLFDHDSHNAHIPTGKILKDYNDDVHTEIKNNILQMNKGILSNKYKELLHGRFLVDLSVQYSLLEESENTMNYTDKIYQYYNTNEFIAEELSIPVVQMMLRHNKIENLRKSNFMSSLNIIEKLLDSFDKSILDESIYKEYDLKEQERLEKLKQRNEFLKNKRKKRKNK